MTGIELIAEERKRQIEQEGWTSDHDDHHANGELAKAASCYALHAGGKRINGPNDDPWRWSSAPQNWPWAREWWKPGNRVKDLAKAGALVAAEIDRLQRKEQGRQTTETEMKLAAENVALREALMEINRLSFCSNTVWSSVEKMADILNEALSNPSPQVAKIEAVLEAAINQECEGRKPAGESNYHDACDATNKSVRNLRGDK